MAIGEHIKRLRQEKGWSQAQLANKLNVHQKQISGYERNIHMPSTDIIIRTAKLFDVSLDYLVFEEREDTLSVKIADRELLRRLEEVDKLSDHDKATIKEILDAFILKNQFQRLAGTQNTQPVAA